MKEKMEREQTVIGKILYSCTCWHVQHPTKMLSTIEEVVWQPNLRFRHGNCESSELLEVLLGSVQDYWKENFEAHYNLQKVNIFPSVSPRGRTVSSLNVATFYPWYLEWRVAEKKENESCSVYHHLDREKSVLNINKSRKNGVSRNRCPRTPDL